MKTKVNLNENFITKAKAIHGEKYLYNLVKYRGSSKKVNIICQNHGVYSMSPSQHLSGKGCPYCEKNRLTRDEFMELMSALYGSRYDFTKCTYTHKSGISEFLTVTCKSHGDFRQRVSALINGKGCDACAKEEKKQVKLKKQEQEEPEIEFFPEGSTVDTTYPVIVKFQTLKPQNNAFLWTEPFESRTEAEQFIETLKMCFDISDSTINEAIVLEKRAQYIDKEHVIKLLYWLSLNSIEAYTNWWDSCRPSFIPRNIKEHYSGIEKYLIDNDVEIIISILDRIKLYNDEGRQVA